MFIAFNNQFLCQRELSSKLLVTSTIRPAIQGVRTILLSQLVGEKKTTDEMFVAFLDVIRATDYQPEISDLMTGYLDKGGKERIKAESQPLGLRLGKIINQIFNKI